MQITCWYRWNGETARWDYNHYGTGIHTTDPIAVSTRQKQVWPSRSWAWAIAELKNYVVINEQSLEHNQSRRLK